MTAIVEQTTAPGQNTNETSTRNLEDVFRGKLRKGSPEASQSIIVLSRTLFAMFVPLTYILLLGLSAYFTFYHALFGMHFNQGAPFPLAVTLYVLPLLSGLSLTILMLRPFFHLRHSNQHHLKLHDNDGAQLIQLVSLIQQQLKCDLDINIQLSMLPVISAEPQGLTLKSNHAVTLVVGLPLIKAMNSQQLSALICHELAHYSHTTYRRAYRWTILTDKWFDDCIQGRDGWKAYFYELEDSGHNSAYVVSGLIGKSAIIANDAILQYLHKAFRKLSKSTLKALDRDADQSAALLSGSIGFSKSLELLRQTSKSWQQNQYRLLKQPSSTLADNFVDEIYVYTNVDKAAELENIAPYLPISWAYHDELDERIEFARHEDVDGIFLLSTPATELFKHFTGLCKSVTPAYYRELGIEFAANSLRPVALNIELQATQDRYKKLIDEFTASTFSPTIVWDVKEARTLTKMAEPQIHKLLNTTVQQFRQQLPVFQDAHIHHLNTQKDVLTYLLAKLRLKHGYISEQQFTHQTESSKQRKMTLSKQTAAFEAYSRCIGMRLSAAVMLDTNKATLIKTLTLLTNLQQLHLVQKHIEQGQQLTVLIENITAQLYSNQETKLVQELNTYTQRLDNINRQLSAKLSALPGELMQVHSINDHIQEQMKLKLLPGRDATDKTRDLFVLLKAEFCSLNIIVTGRLVAYAKKNESTHNIEPITLILSPTLDKSA